MKTIDLEQLVRKNIWAMKPYSSARDEFHGEASVFLDANENPFNTPYDRYPDPKQWALKELLATQKGVRKEQIMLGNGSDEPIDLVIRIFCEPGKDNVVALDPTYGMYKVAAQTNNVEYREVPLNEKFDFESSELLKACDKNTKLIFLCSPNNPSGNSLNESEIIKTIEQFNGIVIVDEAYIDFSTRTSLLKDLNKYPNLVVLQTFSKAWASAAIRLGMAFSSVDIINLFNKVKYPYNINVLTQKYALNILNDYPKIKNWIAMILKERDLLIKDLNKLVCIEKVYPSDANFLLVRTKDADKTYQFLVDRGIIVRNRNNATLCNNCIRITVGTKAENQMLVETLKMLK